MKFLFTRLTSSLAVAASVSLHASVLGYWLYTPNQNVTAVQREPIKIAIKMVEKQQVAAPVAEKVAPKVSKASQASKAIPTPKTQQSANVLTSPKSSATHTAKHTPKPDKARAHHTPNKVQKTPPKQATKAGQTSVAASPNKTVENKVKTQQSTGKSSWESRAFAKLEKARRYPATALLKQQQGVVYIRASIAADGSVLEADLSRSSGIAVLDNAALDTLYRAAPLPELPQDYPRPFVILLPIEFFMS